MTIQSIALTILPLLISFSLSTQPDSRYDTINKPTWTPPPIMFPIVWTTLYILMGYASARIVNTVGLLSFPMMLYTIQLILNISWTPVFFGHGKYGEALTILRVLVIAVLATAVAFWRLDTVAGVLLIPYIAWLSVAHELNRSIVTLN